MAKCDCDLCKRSRKFKKILKRIENTWYPNSFDQPTYEDIKWLEQLYSHLMDIEAELDWYKNKELIKAYINNETLEYEAKKEDWNGFYGTIEKIEEK